MHSIPLCGVITAFFLSAAITVTAAPPDLTNGGVPGDTISFNMGPTGARGWVYHVRENSSESRQIQIKSVATGSPSAGILAANDVILGANGTGADPVNFTSDARKSLADAINDAEARSPATLKLIRWRAGATSTVEITLQTMGAYSATAPYNCPKSALILQQGLQAIMAATGGETTGRYSFSLLTLLAANNPSDPANAARMSRAQTEARARIPNATTRAQMMSDARDATSMVTWERGHTLVALAEYYLATGDTQILPAVEAYAVNIAKNTSLFGTVGHIFAEKFSDGSPNGPMGGVYGPVNSTGMTCYLGLLLARECGLNHPGFQANTEALVEAAIVRSSRFFAYYAGKGSIPYGEHEPYPAHESNGKSGLAALCFALEDNRVAEGKFYAKMATAAPTEREQGHTGSFFNYLWSPLGAAVGGEDAAALHFSRIRWMLDLNRRWDKKFDYDCLNGEGPNSGSTYNDFRMSTAALLVYALPLRQLHLTGRGHASDLLLSAGDLADAAAADTYSVTGRSIADLIADTGSWSPKIRRNAAIQLGVNKSSVTTTQRDQLHATATNTALPAHVRAGACDALGRIANSASASVLANLLADPQKYVRYAAAEALRYMPNADRQAQLTKILSAAAANARPVLPYDEEDPLHFDHGRLAMLLFYSGSAYGPKGILYNTITGVDRNLLYPAIRAVAGTPIGMSRSTLGSIYPLLTKADTLAVADAVVDSVREYAPSDRMFASGVRQNGFDLMWKYDFAEGVPAGMKYIVQCNAGDRTAALNVLKKFAASYTTITPEPDVIALATSFLNATGGSAEQNASVSAAAQAVLDAIAADTNPKTLVPFKGITSTTADQPQITLPANSTVLRVSSYDHAQGDSIFTWRKLSGPGEVIFTPNASADAATSNVQFAGTAGIYQFEVKMSDSRRLTEAYGTVSVVLANASGAVPPTPNPAAFTTAPVAISDSAIHMTATTGSSPNGPVQYLFTEVSGNPGGTSSGWQSSPEYTDTGLNPTTTYSYTVTLRDSLGTAGSPSPAASATTPAAPPRAEVKINGTKFFQSTSATITNTFDARGSDKLVVVLTGEHGFNNNAGTVTSVTYDGVPLTPVIQRNAQVANTDTVYNHIWILDNPAASYVSGTIVANVVNRGNVTVFGLSGTLPGAGATAISATDTRSVDLATTAPNSLVIASFGMGGAGNTADVLNVTVNPPLTFVSAQENGSLWDGHVIGYAKVSSAGPGTYSFSGGNQAGAYVIAAEFPAAPISMPLPTLAPANIVDDQGGGPIPAGTRVNYTLTFSENMNPTSITADDFENAGTAPITIHSVTGIGKVYTVSLTPGSGTLRLRVKAGTGIADIYGNPLDTASPVIDDTTITVNADTDPPALVGITDDRAGETMQQGEPVTYTLTFSEPMATATINASDFGNAGTSSININSVTQPVPGVVNVSVTPVTTGTLQFRVLQGASLADVAGNPLDASAPITDDTVITVDQAIIQVPSVVGMTRAEAEAAIIFANFTVGSVTFQNSGSVAEGNVISQTPSGGTIHAFGAAVDLVVSLGPVQNRSYSAQSIAVSGLVSGALSSTHLSDNIRQSIQEIESAGTPASQRHSYLEHKWRFEITGGDIVTFHIEAHHTANTENDDFTFAYSTAGVNGPWTNMLAVTKTGDTDTTQSFELPPGTSGTIHVRVIDTDRTAGRRVLDTVYIDHMYFLTESSVVMTTVPGVTGFAQATAESNIMAANLTVGAVTTVNHASIPAGNVISQTPAGGTSVAEGSVVDLVVSLGPDYAGDYEAWSLDHEPADLTDPAADLDGDGISNQEERLWGLDPKSAASANPIKTHLDAASGTFTYTRRDPSLTGCQHSVWFTGDFSKWEQDLTAQQITVAADANGVQTVVVTLSPEVRGSGRLFVRVKATAPQVNP